MSGDISEKQFLANAILHAERAHTGRGIWDVYYSSRQQQQNDETTDDVTVAAQKGLLHCVENAVDSIYHYDRFVILRDDCKDGGGSQPVACACGFKYPDVNMGKVLKGLRTANEEVLGWTGDDCDRAEASLSFLSQTFPDGVEFTDRWMIEAVFTDPGCRGRGLAYEVLTQVLQRGRDQGCKEALITCAVGNTPAFQLYTKLGFESQGAGDSEECQQQLSTRGFHVLRYVYPT